MERKQIEQSDVTHVKENSQKEQHALCLNNNKRESTITAQNFNSFSDTHLFAMTTRNNPNKNKRAPNKKIFKMDIHSSPDNNTSPDKQSRDISTQTDLESNKGKAISVIQDHKNAELFTAIDDLSTPDYRQNLMRVFNEEFLAEHSKKDLGPIINTVNNRDWLSLKKSTLSSTKSVGIYPLHQLFACYLVTDWLSPLNYDPSYYRPSLVNILVKRECSR